MSISYNRQREIKGPSDVREDVLAGLSACRLRVYSLNLQALSYLDYDKIVVTYANTLNTLWNSFVDFLSDSDWATASYSLLNKGDDLFAQFSDDDQSMKDARMRQRVVQLIKLRNKSIAKNRIDAMIGDVVYDEYLRYVDYLSGRRRLTKQEMITIRQAAVTVLQKKYPQLNVREYIEHGKRNNAAILTQSLPTKQLSRLKQYVRQSLRPSKSAVVLDAMTEDASIAETLKQTFSARIEALLRKAPTNAAVNAINNEIDIYSEVLINEMAKAYAEDRPNISRNLKEYFYNYKAALFNNLSLDKFKRLMVRQSGRYFMTPEAESYLLKTLAYIEPRYSMYGRTAFDEDGKIKDLVYRGYREGLTDRRVSRLFDMVQQRINNPEFMRRLISSNAEKRVVDFDMRSAAKINQFLKDSKRSRYFMRLATTQNIGFIKERVRQLKTKEDANELIRLIRQSTFDDAVCSICKKLHGVIYDTARLLDFPNLLPPSHPFCRCQLIPIPSDDVAKYLASKLNKGLSNIKPRARIAALLSSISGIALNALPTVQGETTNKLAMFVDSLKNPGNLLALVGAFFVGRGVAGLITKSLGRSKSSLAVSLNTYIDQSHRVSQTLSQETIESFFEDITEDYVKSTFSGAFPEIYALLKQRNYASLIKTAQKDISYIRSLLLRQSVDAADVRESIRRHHRVRLIVNGTNIVRLNDCKTATEFLSSVEEADAQRLNALLRTIDAEDSVDMMTQPFLRIRGFVDSLKSKQIENLPEIDAESMQRLSRMFEEQIQWMSRPSLNRIMAANVQVIDLLDRYGRVKNPAFRRLHILRQEMNARRGVEALRNELDDAIRQLRGDSSLNRDIEAALRELNLDQADELIMSFSRDAMNQRLDNLVRVLGTTNNIDEIDAAIRQVDAIAIEDDFLYGRFRQSLSIQFDFIRQQNSLVDDDMLLFQALAISKSSPEMDVLLREWSDQVTDKERLFNYLYERITNYFRQTPIASMASF